MSSPIVRITRDRPLVQWMESLCFPGEGLDDDILAISTLWVATIDGKPVGYASGRLTQTGDGFYFNRAGVLPAARGRGVQRDLIRARLRHARKLGCKYAVTYTSASNVRSCNNLIRCGFILYVPEYLWVGPLGKGWLYWIKDLV